MLAQTRRFYHEELIILPKFCFHGLSVVHISAVAGNITVKSVFHNLNVIHLGLKHLLNNCTFKQSLSILYTMRIIDGYMAIDD